MQRLVVNDKTHEIDVTPNTPLLWVLRDILNLTGTKYGCGKGLCGACTVHVNGNALRSCSVTVESVNGANITTIEGLSKNGDHPLQEAWIKHKVPQCGFCQSGQIMSAAALLNQNPKPSSDQIANYMSANICRCGTYVRIQAAIEEVADQGA